ncbi:MAG: cyclic nucleotide-binding domain-containing protein [Puia sp.]
MGFLLEKIKRFIRLSESEEQILEGLFVEKHFARGDFFLRENQVCRHLGLIHQGIIRYYINAGGEDKTYYFGREGDFVCEYESFIQQTSSDKNIQVLEDCSIFLISFGDLQRLYSEIKEGNLFGRIGIEQVFVSILQQLTSFYNDPHGTPIPAIPGIFSGYSSACSAILYLLIMWALNLNHYHASETAQKNPFLKSGKVFD